MGRSGPGRRFTARAAHPALEIMPHSGPGSLAGVVHPSYPNTAHLAGCSKGPAARRRPTAAREAYSPPGGAREPCLGHRNDHRRSRRLAPDEARPPRTPHSRSWAFSAACGAAHGKGGRNDPVDAGAVPAPGRHVAPVAGAWPRGPWRTPRPRPRASARPPLHEDLAVDDDRVHVAPAAGVHQRLDGIGVEAGAEVIEVDQQDVGLGARGRGGRDRRARRNLQPPSVAALKTSRGSPAW